MLNVLSRLTHAVDSSHFSGAIERQHNQFPGSSGNSPHLHGSSGNSPHLHGHHHASNTSSPHSRLHHDGYGEIRDNNEIAPRRIRDDIPDSDLIDYEDDGEGESLLGV